MAMSCRLASSASCSSTRSADPVSERPYFSIGEVLGLLLEEFPDVSISKIRFLENQGLIDPERTPSGYRKFYDRDLDRLRYILREQKEHYLPLKVIKERLEGTDGTPAATPRPLPTGASWALLGNAALPEDEPVMPSAADLARAERALIERADRAAERAQATATLSAGVSAISDDTMEPRTGPGLVDQTGEARIGVGAAEGWRSDLTSSSTPGDPTGPIDTRAGSTESSPPPGAGSNQSPHDISGAEATAPSGLAHDPASAAAPTTAAVTAAVTAPTEAPIPVATAHVARPPAPSVTASTVARSAAVVASASGPAEPVPTIEAGEVSIELSSTDLCSRAGITPQQLTQLRDYGLLEPTMVGGEAIFGLEALRTASAAGKLAGHGLEARHLRTWKVSAEREATLFEQMIQPFVRQRNPTSRRQAAELAGELSRAGGELRAALMRQALRQYLDG